MVRAAACEGSRFRFEVLSPASLLRIASGFVGATYADALTLLLVTAIIHLPLGVIAASIVNLSLGHLPHILLCLTVSFFHCL